MTKMVKAIKLIFFFLLLVIGISCKSNNSSIDYLQKVLANLEKIESASYSSLHESWLPGDTAAYGVYCRLYKEFNNPVDTAIGVSYVWFDCDMPTVFRAAYDGTIQAETYKDKKIIVIDNFTARPLPFRPVSTPFFNRTKNIIQYALTTKDSVILDLKEYDEYYYFKLVIKEDKKVEFFGKAYYMPNNPYTLDPTSIYELWINKSNYLPYKARREMSHQTTIETVSNVVLNKLSIADFNIHDLFPKDYEIRKNGETNGEQKDLNLTGKIAPSWILNDKDERKVSLSEFKGKILLLQLTGIGCGPCAASIPFLKEIKNKYSDDRFAVIAIETWKRKTNTLQYYSKKNELNYNLLSGTDDVVKDYQTGGLVPVFFIMDKELVIRKIIKGYSEESTRKEIIETINKLL